MCAVLSMGGCEQLATKPDAPTPSTRTEPPTAASSAEPAPTPGPLRPPEIEASPNTSSGVFAGLVAYTNWLRQRDPADLQRLLAAAEARALNPGSDLDRLRLAILLSQSRAPFRNEARARELVQYVIRNGDGDTAMFAYTLQWDLQDRHAHQGDCDRALAKERQQRAALKQKLNELKAIEEQIHRRDTKTPATP